MKSWKNIKLELKNYEELHVYDRDDKVQFMDHGEWIDEPDHITFEYKGLKCRIRRTFVTGALCGYVCLPPELIKSENYDDYDIEVHGGLTYGCIEEDGSFWLGFDCSHSGDISPAMQKFKESVKKRMKEKFPDIIDLPETYRNLGYCIRECISMVDQLLKS